MAHDPAPGEPWILNDPYAGGTHLPDLTHRHAHRARLRGDARAPRRRRRLGAGEPPRRLADARRGGSRHPADAARRRDARRRSSRGCGTRTSAAATCALSSRRTALAEGRVVELCARRGRERVAAAMDELLAYSERRRARGASSRSPGRHASRAPTRSRRPRAARDPRRRDDRAATRSTSTSTEPPPQYDGNLNCPLAVTRSACFYVVRCLDRARPAGLGRRVRARSRCAPRRAASSTPARPPPSRRATRRRRAGSRTSSSTRSHRRSPCPRRARGR